MQTRYSVPCLIAVALNLSATGALADGTSGQTSSDYERSNKKVSPPKLPTLRMRKGEIDTKDLKLEADMYGFQDSNGGAGLGAKLEVRKDMLINGASDQDGSHGVLFNPGARIVLEKDNSGSEDNQVYLREAEGTLGAVYSGQKIFRPAIKELAWDHPARESVYSLDGEISQQEERVREAERAARNADDVYVERVKVDAVRVETDPRQLELEKEIAAMEQESSELYSRSRNTFLLTKGKKIAQERVDALARDLNRAVDEAEKKKKIMDGVKSGTEIHPALSAEFEKSHRKVREIQGKLREYGASDAGEVHEQYNGYRNTTCTYRDHGVDCGEFVSRCKRAGYYVPCVKDGHAKIIQYNPDQVAAEFPEQPQWMKVNYPRTGVLEAKRADRGKLEAESQAKRDQLEKERQAKISGLEKDRQARIAQLRKENVEKKKRAAAEEKKRLAELIAKREKAKVALAALEAAAKNKKRPAYATADAKLGQFGGLYRNRKEIGLKHAGLIVEPITGSFHVAGRLNGNPVGLCGAISPIRFVFGEESAFDSQAMACAEVGLGERVTLRDSFDVNTDFDKFVVVRNTLGADFANGHVNVGWTYERETNRETDERVNRNTVGVKFVY